MSRQKIENQSIRKLARIGDRSLGLTLPVEIIRQLGWREKQKVVVTKRGQGILIKDWPVKK